MTILELFAYLDTWTLWEYTYLGIAVAMCALAIPLFPPK